jgi:ABC-type multidrug transport system fused ATPase/permease subunit
MPLYLAAGQEKHASEVFGEATGRLRKSAMRMGTLLGVSAGFQELAGLAALVAMLAMALRIEHAQVMQAGALLVFFFVARLSLPVLATYPESILDIAERLPRCQALLAAFDDEGKFIVIGGAREFRDLREGICFDRLTFGYPDREPVLREASFEIA